MKYLLDKLESFICRLQGKGSGSTTTKAEVKHAFKLYGKDPSQATVIDIGGNNGEWSREAIKNMPKNLYIFEPQEHCYKILMKLFSNEKGVKIVNAACGINNEEGTLYFDEIGSGLASLTKRNLKHFNVSMNQNQKIKIMRLDSFIEVNKIKEVSILKIDVEGHELDVLFGLGEFLANRPPDVIQFEFGGCNIDTRTFFQDFWNLLSIKYTIYRQSLLGLTRIDNYSELLEHFRTTNYFCKLKNSD
jgi:FkbM family methyltransferase